MSMPVPHSTTGEELERDAEIRRIARLVGQPHTEFAYLSPLPSAELRQLRDQITAALFDHQVVLAKFAAATKILPVAMVASLAERAFGPMLAARIAGLVEPDRAVDIASRLPVSFLAQVAKELDPRRGAAILAEVPVEMVAAVTRQLVAEEEWVTMGTFYGYLPDLAIRAAMSAADPHAMLQISLVLDDKSRLAHVLELAGPETLVELSGAAESAGLSAQLRALEIYLTPAQRAQLTADG